MPRVNLQVPFDEKDEAKRLGARWDGRTWYVPEGLGVAGFEKWLPQPQAANIRAPTWDFVSSQRECWRCGRHTRVFAVVLPSEHEALIVEDDPRDDRWECGECAVLLSYLNDVPAAVAVQLHVLAPRYRVDHSDTTHSFYRMNHCEHCEAKLGDFEIMGEPGTFYTLGPGLDERKLMVEDLRHIAEPFCGHCGGYATVEERA